MHIADIERGILGANGIVGAGIGLGTGAALSSKLRGSGQICLVFFGDGAANEGIFHEALNMASVWKLPAVFLCENNQFALSTRMSDAASIDRHAKRAASYSWARSVRQIHAGYLKALGRTVPATAEATS